MYHIHCALYDYDKTMIMWYELQSPTSLLSPRSFHRLLPLVSILHLAAAAITKTVQLLRHSQVQCHLSSDQESQHLELGHS